MKEQWSRFAGWVDARTLRERSMIFAAFVALLVMAVNALVLSRFVDAEARLQKQMKADRVSTEALQKEIGRFAGSVQEDPNTRGKRRVEELAAQLSGLDSEVKNIEKGLVQPKQILPLLDRIVRQQAGLELVSITKLPPVGMSLKPESQKAPAQQASTGPATDAAAAAALHPTAPAEKASEVAPLMYRHAVEVVVRGTYPDLLNYLVTLERLPQQVFWGHVKLVADEYPKSTLQVELFTLGLEKTWLNL